MRFLSLEGDGVEGCIKEIVQEMEHGNPVVLPTETLYGLACPYDDRQCIERIFAIKERPHEMTLPVTVPYMEMIGTIGHYPMAHKELIEGLMPGPVTIIIKARSDLPPGLARNGTIAVRVPDHPLYVPLCARTGPLVMTSANVHRANPVRNGREAVEQFGSSVGLMVLDGSLKGDRPSTIIDLTGDEVKVVREGVVPIERVLGRSDTRRSGGDR